MMFSTDFQRETERRCECEELCSTWGSLIDQGLRQANDSLIALEASRDAEIDGSREDWLLIGRAFECSASALQALAN